MKHIQQMCCYADFIDDMPVGVSGRPFCTVHIHDFKYDILSAVDIERVLRYPLGSSLRWRQNGRDSVSNHQPHDCLLNRLFRRRSKKTPKPRVTGLCVGNTPGTGEFPAQMDSYAENVSIWWHHHGEIMLHASIRIYDDLGQHIWNDISYTQIYEK